MTDSYAIQRSTRYARSAFTLIELLVVIAIIALLISILLPSLSKSRSVAKMVLCQTIQRNMGAASAAYGVEYRGYNLPQSVPTPNGRSYTVWNHNIHFRKTMGMNPPAGWNVYTAPRNLICPDATWALSHPAGDADKNNKYGKPTVDPNGLYRITFAYGMNPVGLPSWHGQRTPTSPQNKFAVVRGLKTHEVRLPQAKIHVMDSMWGDPTWGARKRYILTGENFVPPAGNWAIAWRHFPSKGLQTGMVNVLHYDGHTEPLTAGIPNDLQMNDFSRWHPQR